MLKADPLQLMLSRLKDVKRGGDRYLACCPAHNDKSPSLSLSHGEDGRALVHCHAGCDTRDVLAAINMEFRDLFPGGLNREQRRQYRRATLEKERSFECIVIEIGESK